MRSTIDNAFMQLATRAVGGRMIYAGMRIRKLTSVDQGQTVNRALGSLRGKYSIQIIARNACPERNADGFVMA